MSKPHGSHRSTNEGQRASLKTASHALVRALGGIEAAETVTRISDAHLARCYGADHGQYLPVDVILDLELAAPRPFITECLARLQGYYIFRPPQAGGSVISSALAAIGRDTGRVFENAGEALADGTIDPDEAMALSLRCDDLIQAAIDLKSLLEPRKLKGGA